jgi:hypothetical protein
MYFKDCNNTFANFEANTHKMADGFLAFKLASKGGLVATFSIKISKSLYPDAYCTVQYKYANSLEHKKACFARPHSI